MQSRILDDQKVFGYAVSMVKLLADQLFTWRVKANLSRKDLAVRCGVSKQTIANWESGASEPTWKSLQKLMSALSPQDPLRLLKGIELKGIEL